MGWRSSVSGCHHAGNRVTHETGLLVLSTSSVKRVTTCHQPQPTSSTETTSARSRTRLSTGTGAGNLIRLKPYELFGPIPVGS